MQSISAVIFLLTLSVSDAANILGIFTSMGPSHVIVHMATIKALVEKGHNVTVVTTLQLKERNKGYHHIHVPPSDADEAEYLKTVSAAAAGDSTFNSFKKLVSANVQRVRIHDKALKHPRFQELLNNTGNHFDLMILGYIFNTFQLGVAAHFKCPVIVSWINQPTGGLLSIVGNPVAVSSVPFLQANPNSIMTFGQRVKNFLWSGVFMTIEGLAEYKMKEYYDEHFPAERYPSFEEVKKNVSLVFCSTHFSEGLIRPMVPGFVEIGGIQIKEKPNRLPKDIFEFLKTANDGFILFTLGTNIKTTDLSSNTTMAIFKVLSKIGQKVLWKWDGAEFPGKSSNIMFKKWFPQDDLLAHPKLRLFITHAGKASVVEAQYHGVPMLAIPVLGDQFIIAHNMETMGFGLTVNHRNATEESFRKQLQEVLENTSYLATVLKFSMLYRDRPMTPKQTVVYWTEYVIRHQGAKHIQSPAIHLNFFQRNSIDVIGFLCLCSYLICVAFRELLRLLISRNKIKVE